MSRPSHIIERETSDSAQIGSVVIVLHAPSDKEVETVDEILSYAVRPGPSILHPFLTC